MSSAFAAALGLTDWPFGVIPDPEATLIWADRGELLNQITRLLRRLTGTQDSSLHLLWADFGAGKTHTLLYLRQLALSRYADLIYPVYFTLPKDARSFIDIYRAALPVITVQKLMDTYSKLPKDSQVFSSANPFMGDRLQSLSTVFKTLTMGSDSMKQTARKWILADQSLSRQELISASLPDRIRNDDDACYTLSGICRLLTSRHPRLLIMIDEFQRAGLLRSEIQNKIRGGLHTFFNNCPKRISMILSFKFGSEKEIHDYLSPELEDRADSQTIAIPALQPRDAEEFLRDLIESAHAASSPSRIDDDVIPAIVKCVSSTGSTKPRTLTKTAGLILSEGAMDIIDGLVGAIDKAYAHKKCEELMATIIKISREDEQETA
ncbi:MAG: hypothetical protein ACLFVA_04030 [Dehalococcoidia bacterium]